MPCLTLSRKKRQKKLKNITCPVLVTGSKDDQVLSMEATEELIANLTESTKLLTHIYENYGHASYDTAPDYRKIVLEFLR